MRKGLFSCFSVFKAFSYFIRYSFFSLPPNSLHYLVFDRFLKGKNLFEVFGYVEDFLDRYLLSALNLKVLKEIDKAKKNNSYVVILSNAPSYLVEQIRKRLNVSSFKATSYGLDLNNRLSSIHNLMDGEAKARYALDLARSLDVPEKKISVYTDSIWDLPLLKIAGKKVVVSPDRGLFKIAKRKAWKIL